MFETFVLPSVFHHLSLSKRKSNFLCILSHLMFSQKLAFNKEIREMGILECCYLKSNSDSPAMRFHDMFKITDVLKQYQFAGKNLRFVRPTIEGRLKVKLC